MKRITFTIGEILLILFGILFCIVLFAIVMGKFFPKQTPIVNVVVNLTEPKQKDLTAGDHTKAILKIGWNKFIEGAFGLLLPWK